MKGMRQPQVTSASWLSICVSKAALSEPKRKPAPTLTCCHEPRKPRFPLGREFHDIGGRSAPFAARRQALQEPDDDEQSGSEDADLLIGRQQADRQGREGH